MKHLILAAATALAIATAPANISAAQPDHAAIAAQAKTSSYTDLLKKFKDGKQLTEAEATTLYYGSALQPGFTPDKDYTPVIAAYNSGDMKRAYNLANEALASDPTNLALLFKAYAAASASADPNIKAQAPAFQTRLLAICDAKLQMVEKFLVFILQSSAVHPLLHEQCRHEMILQNPPTACTFGSTT